MDEFSCPELGDGAFMLKSNQRCIRFLNLLEEALMEGQNNVINDRQALNLVLHNYSTTCILNRYEKEENGFNAPWGGFSMGAEDDRLTVPFVPIDRSLNGHVWRYCVDTARGWTAYEICAARYEGTHSEVRVRFGAYERGNL